jgi:hypothetical protein
MFCHERFDLPEFRSREPCTVVQLDGIKPDLGATVVAHDVYVSRLAPIG